MEKEENKENSQILFLKENKIETEMISLKKKEISEFNKSNNSKTKRDKFRVI